MGIAVQDMRIPLIKGISGVIVSKRAVPTIQEDPCIRCGRCLEACPMLLNPSRLVALVRIERPEELLNLHIKDCFECASCSFVCPSHIPLVQLLRVGKALARQHEAAK